MSSVPVFILLSFLNCDLQGLAQLFFASERQEIKDLSTCLLVLGGSQFIQTWSYFLSPKKFAREKYFDLCQKLESENLLAFLRGGGDKER